MRVWVILGWLIAGLVGMGVLGFELMPAGNRGLWLFLIVLLVLGAFLPIWLAVGLGVLTFGVFAVYIALVSELRNLSGAELLALFYLPLAPVWLAAFRIVLAQTDGLVRFARTFRRRHAALIDPEHEEMTTLMLRRIFPRIAARWRATGTGGTLSVVAVDNDRLARDLLGDEAWRNRRAATIRAIREARPGSWLFLDDVRADRFILVDDGDADIAADVMAAAESVGGVKAQVARARFPDQGDSADDLLRAAHAS